MHYYRVVSDILDLIPPQLTVLALEVNCSLLKILKDPGLSPWPFQFQAKQLGLKVQNFDKAYLDALTFDSVCVSKRLKR